MKEINIKSSTVEKGIELLTEFFAKFINPSIDELGQLFSDNIKVWRLNNQIRNVNKIKKIVSQNNIKIKNINLKVLIPYLEGVSLEEDETLQDLWAKLFVNYIDSDKNLSINIYPSILSQLSTNEVRILEAMQENKGTLNLTTFKRNKIVLNEDEIGNLIRLGIIEEELNIHSYSMGPDNDIYVHNNVEVLESENFNITRFGHKFLTACKR